MSPEEMIKSAEPKLETIKSYLLEGYLLVLGRELIPQIINLLNSENIRDYIQMELNELDILALLIRKDTKMMKLLSEHNIPVSESTIFVTQSSPPFTVGDFVYVTTVSLSIDNNMGLEGTVTKIIDFIKESIIKYAKIKYLNKKYGMFSKNFIHAS